MIKIIKYTVFVMMAVIFIIFCAEPAYYYLYDKVSEKMNCISLDFCYNTEQIEKDIADTFKKYDVSAFYIINEEADTDNDIWVCVNSSENKIKKHLGVNNCSYNTIISGRHSLIITDMSKVKDVVSRDYSLYDIYFYSDENTAYELCDELSEKYKFSLSLPQKAEDHTTVIWIICASLILLMSIYDVFESKKEVCIKLTLGNSLIRQIAGIVLKDSIVFISASLLMGLLLYNVTAVIMIIKTYVIYVLSICFMNGLVFFSLYLTDVCSTLKNENGAAGYIYINYILKIASCAVLIFMLSLADIFYQQLEEQKCAEEFGRMSGDISYVTMFDSPLWTSMEQELYEQNEFDPEDDRLGQLNDKRKDDQKKLISRMDQKYGVFFMGDIMSYSKTAPNNGYSYNVLLASDMMRDYIEKQTGIAPEHEGVTIYLPRNYSMAQRSIVDEWIDNKSSEYTFDVTWKNYDKAMFMGTDLLVKERLGSNLILNVTDSPVIVYAAHSEDFDYFGRQSFFVAAERKSAEAIRKSSMIISLMTESVPCSSVIRDHVRKNSSIIILFVLMNLSAFVYYLAIVISTITVDINVHKRERAVLKILGKGIVSRYFVFMLSFVGTLTVSAATVYVVIAKVGFASQKSLMISVPILFVMETLAVIIAAKLDEKHNTLKELKGGAL